MSLWEDPGRRKTEDGDIWGLRYEAAELSSDACLVLQAKAKMEVAARRRRHWVTSQLNTPSPTGVRARAVWRR